MHGKRHAQRKHLNILYCNPLFWKHWKGTNTIRLLRQDLITIAPDKDWRQLGIYPPLFDLIGYFKFYVVLLLICLHYLAAYGRQV